MYYRKNIGFDKSNPCEMFEVQNIGFDKSNPYEKGTNAANTRDTSKRFVFTGQY